MANERREKEQKHKEFEDKKKEVEEEEKWEEGRENRVQSWRKFQQYLEPALCLIGYGRTALLL